jgi:hypothetical protein
MALSVVVFANEADGAGLVWRAVSKLGSLISDLGDVAGGCTNGQIMEYQTSNSTWICATDDAGSGSGFTIISSAPATDAKLIQDNSTSSTTVSLKTLTAGTGISLTNGTSAVTITNTVTDTTGFTNIASESVTSSNATLIGDNSTVANRATIKTISAGDGIHLTNNAQNIIINSTVPVFKMTGANVTTQSTTTFINIFTIPLTIGGNFISGYLLADSDGSSIVPVLNNNVTTNANSRGACSYLSPTSRTASSIDNLPINGTAGGTLETTNLEAANSTAITFNCSVFSTANNNLLINFRSDTANRPVSILNGSFYMVSHP